MFGCFLFLLIYFFKIILIDLKKKKITKNFDQVNRNDRYEQRIRKKRRRQSRIRSLDDEHHDHDDEEL